MADDTARIPIKRAAGAVGVPEATLRLWLRPHRSQATPDGYPIATVVAVLAAHGRNVADSTLAAAGATRRLRAQRAPSQPSQPAQLAEREAATAAYLDLIRAEREAQAQLVAVTEAMLATNREMLAELRALRGQLQTAQGSQPARAPWWLRLARWLEGT